MKHIKILLLLFFTVQFSNAQIFEEISVDEAKTLIEENIDNPLFTILDVRTPAEYLPAHIEGAFNRNFYDADFEQQLDSLNKNRVYLIYCQSGGRSGATLDLVESLNFTEVYDMLGGMNAWNGASYPTTDVIPELIDLTAEVEINTNTESLSTAEKISVYPNPSNGFIQLPKEIIACHLFDVNGKPIQIYTNQEIDLSTLSNGIYFIQLIGKDLDSSHFQKLIIQK